MSFLCWRVFCFCNLSLRLYFISLHEVPGFFLLFCLLRLLKLARFDFTEFETHSNMRIFLFDLANENLTLYNKIMCTFSRKWSLIGENTKTIVAFFHSKRAVWFVLIKFPFCENSNFCFYQIGCWIWISTTY